METINDLPVIRLPRATSRDPIALLTILPIYGGFDASITVSRPLHEASKRLSGEDPKLVELEAAAWASQQGATVMIINNRA
jgi:hypothetical protein